MSVAPPLSPRATSSPVSPEQPFVNLAPHPCRCALTVLAASAACASSRTRRASCVNPRRTRCGCSSSCRRSWLQVRQIARCTGAVDPWRARGNRVGRQGAAGAAQSLHTRIVGAATSCRVIGPSAVLQLRKDFGISRHQTLRKGCALSDRLVGRDARKAVTRVTSG